MEKYIFKGDTVLGDYLTNAFYEEISVKRCHLLGDGVIEGVYVKI